MNVVATLLSCQHLIRHFGERAAVDDVSFEVAPGETYGLLGPNGAGKTTTIRMICGLLDPDGGQVRIDGDEVDGRNPAVRARIGYVPQDVALYPDLTARENLRFFGRLYGLRRRQLEQRVEEVLTTIDLAERGDERVDAYSGGMRRRLNIGAALLHHPQLLVLDEPTVGVDPQSRHAILSAVRSFGEGGTAILYTTHYMEEAERLCDRVGIIDRGRLIAEGTHRELVARLGQRDRIDLTARGDLARFAAACSHLEGIESASQADGSIQLLAADGRRLLPVVLEQAEHAGVTVTSVELVEPDLEAVFLHLTGTALRE